MGMTSWLTVTAATGRTVLDGSGNSTVETPVLAAVRVSEFWPASAEIRNRPTLQTPNELLQTFCLNGADIQPGDSITPTNSRNVKNKRYPIRAVERWPWMNGALTFKLLVLEDLKDSV